MRVLWLGNLIIPSVSESLNEKLTPFGGWISSMLDCLSKYNDLEIFYCFPYEPCEKTISGKVNLLHYCGFNPKNITVLDFVRIIKKYNPDIIHVWGTEYPHTLKMVIAAKNVDMLDKLVINIQGLVSVISKYHYYANIPFRVRYSFTLADFLRVTNIALERKKMAINGIDEISAIKNCKRVIGRTEWDRAVVSQIDDGILYYKCNEVLRPIFYTNRWSIDNCEKHTIFFSQANYPLKGFHILLEALPVIINKFPDVHVYVAANNPLPNSIKSSLKQHSYVRYLCKLIKKWNLSQYISFCGLLSEKQMCETYLRSNVFVSSSSIENSSNSIGEAMLLGMPVIASDVGGVKDFINHKRNGFIYQFDAPYMLAYYVNYLFKNKDVAKEIGNRAHEIARDIYDIKKNSETLYAIYETISRNNKG